VVLLLIDDSGEPTMTSSLSARRSFGLTLLFPFVVLLAFGGFYVIGHRQQVWGQSLQLRASFQDIQGVLTGTPVRINGINVGQVSDIGLPPAEAPDSCVILTLKIDAKYQYLLFADAMAEIQSEGLVGVKVVALHPGRREAGPLAVDAIVPGRLTPDLAELTRKLNALTSEIANSNGTLKKLIVDDGLYRDVRAVLQDTQALIEQSKQTVARVETKLDVASAQVNELVKDTRQAIAGLEGKVATVVQDSQQVIRTSEETLNSIKQDADAIKRMPIIRGYVEDSAKILVKPSHLKNRQVYDERDLFEPGRAVLTHQGHVMLDGVAQWMNSPELKVKGSEVVVVVYADPKQYADQAAAAKTTTTQQAEAVVRYLRERHKVHSMGWVSTRPVTALGMGVQRPPQPESEPLPANRVELIVFTPQR
jgi:phospholipid/cholesterol/gamma-HCH transport system substrate-binding protein